MNRSWLLSLVLLLMPCPSTAQDQVRVWHEPLNLPSYEVGAPDRNPLFYDGRRYQGAQGPIYPYSLIDSLTDNRTGRNWDAVYLENRWIKVSVLPEIGGRIFSGTDKTNGYDFFYRQHVIKPALIGMLGAWISGGVEWNIPHHHRASSFMPVDSTITENPDGSKTVWVGEIELRHRMKWWIGITLHPDRACVEATVRLFNRTPLVHSALYWANPAVHANDNYQVIFPPDVEFATFHAKNQFARWPISHEVYGGADYTKGVDISWWKNHPEPTSFFVFHSDMDFLGGYDHGRKAGVVEVSDRHSAPGKKFWEWGPGARGRIWDRILTDADGPYIELMAGGFSDNQPDYSWIQPYETKTVRQYWYPVREIGGVKNATIDAAVNLEVKDGTASVGFVATSTRAGATAILLAGDKELLKRRIDISPATPFVTSLKLPAGVTDEQLEARLVDSGGTVLVAYRPVRKPGSPMPEPVKAPLKPVDIKSVEELYLTGLRLEQFYNAEHDPEPYYAEALKRDPGNSDVNTALGIRLLRRGEYAKAEERLRTAVGRLTRDYTRPRSGEAWYYLGIVLRWRGKPAEAEEAFQRAAWDLGFAAAAHAAIAEIASKQGNLDRALEYFDRSLGANPTNHRIIGLRAAILRRLGRADEARSAASRVLTTDPLDSLARNEVCLADTGAGRKTEAEQGLATLHRQMRGSDASYLELAADYGAAGLWAEAVEVLRRRQADSSTPAGPMVGYFLAYYAERGPEKANAAALYQAASRIGPDGGFPFQLEAEPVLRRAMEVNPADSRAPYYLGNLLYDLQPAEAIRLWEKSRELDPGFATVHRNLAFGYSRSGADAVRAIASLEKALSLDGTDPRLLLELDQLYESTGAAPEKRISTLEARQATVLKRDYAMEREVILLVRAGRYDDAIAMLTKHHFHVWEGGAGIHGAWEDAHVLRGEERLAAGRAREALADFQAALEYPENLEVARPDGDGSPRVLYLIGVAQQALGDAAASRKSLESAARPGSRGENAYYRALALRKLGRESDAAAAVAQIGRPVSRRSEEPLDSRTRNANALYLEGLTLLGKGDNPGAVEKFRAALKAQPAHTGAAFQLRKTQPPAGH